MTGGRGGREELGVRGVGGQVLDSSRGRGMTEGKGEGRELGERGVGAVSPRFLAGPRNDGGARGSREDPARNPLGLRLVQGER